MRDRPFDAVKAAMVLIVLTFDLKLLMLGYRKAERLPLVLLLAYSTPFPKGVPEQRQKTWPEMLLPSHTQVVLTPSVLSAPLYCTSR